MASKHSRAGFTLDSPILVRAAENGARRALDERRPARGI